MAEVDGELRVWSERRVDEEVSAFYRERFNPTLEPLLELDFDRVLVTHGEPRLKDAREELARALRAEPWYHRRRRGVGRTGDGRGFELGWSGW